MAVAASVRDSSRRLYGVSRRYPWYDRRPIDPPARQHRQAIEATDLEERLQRLEDAAEANGGVSEDSLRLRLEKQERATKAPGRALYLFVGCDGADEVQGTLARFRTEQVVTPEDEVVIIKWRTASWKTGTLARVWSEVPRSAAF